MDSNLVAVAPFDVLDPSLELWGEGLMDVLTEDLDGAGPLRTVAQSFALRRWSGRANRGSAEKFGVITGAGLIVYGKVARRGQDSVSIRVTLLDRTPNADKFELVEVAGPEGRMGELADSLGVKILRTLGRSRAIGSQRHVSIGSRSLPALKEFLKGEQFYRRGLTDSALARYDRAIAEDSTFALALRRMAWATGSGGSTSWKYASQDEYRRRAAILNRGLSPRDSVLLKVDSLLFLGTRSRDAREIIASYYAAVGSVEELVRRYPDDPAIWYELGEHRMHGSPPLGGLPGPALDAFDRAIALDSGFAPGYQHTVRLALQLGQVERAREYARAYAALNPSDVNAPALRLAMLVFDSGGVHTPAVWRQIKDAHGSTLVWTGHDHFRWMVDTAETAVVLLRELIAGKHDRTGLASFVADSTLAHHLAVALVFRGHLRAAADVTRAQLIEEGVAYYRFSIDRFLDLALWNILPDSIVRRTYQRGLMPGTDWSVGSTFSTPRFLRALPYWYARGDSTTIFRFAQRAGEVARTNQPGVAPLRGRYFETASRGYLALMRGDSAEAERYFENISDTLCLVGTCFNEKLVLAQLIAARGDDRRAAEILDQWELAGDNTTFAVIAALERAEIAERLGDRATAVARYQFVIDAWRRADPELQPFVAQARAGLQRHRQ
jgi:tetratricopeptide (TPR) repeat protein